MFVCLVIANVFDDLDIETSNLIARTSTTKTGSSDQKHSTFRRDDERDW